MLWIYAENDSYFGPKLANEMATAYASVGGKVQFYEPASHESDGHSLFFDPNGSKIWGPLFQQYLDGVHHPVTLPTSNL